MSVSGDSSERDRSAPAVDPLFGLQVCVGSTGPSSVWVSGELDVATAGLLRDGLALASVGCDTPLIVDMSSLRFMDAAGIGVLLAANQHLLACGGVGLVVRGATVMVRKVLEITGQSHLLEDELPARSTVRRVPSDGDREVLEGARTTLGLSCTDLFVGYLALGGTSDWDRFAGHLAGDSALLDGHQHDIAVHVVNEFCGDVGRTDQLLAYSSS